MYRRVKSLGFGGEGEAWLIEGKQTKKQLVLKEIDLSNLDEAEIQESVEQASIMKQVNHPNVVKIHDVFTTKANMLCIVMEYANQGDFNQLIEKRFKKLDIWDDDQAYFSE